VGMEPKPTILNRSVKELELAAEGGPQETLLAAGKKEWLVRGGGGGWARVQDNFVFHAERLKKVWQSILQYAAPLSGGWLRRVGFSQMFHSRASF